MSLTHRCQLYRGASPGYAEISQPPSAHSFLSVVLQPRRKKQVLLNRQAEQVVRTAVPETRVSHTHTHSDHTNSCSYIPIPFRFIRFSGFASKYTLLQKRKPVYEKSKSQCLKNQMNLREGQECP